MRCDPFLGIRSLELGIGNTTRIIHNPESVIRTRLYDYG